jgi:hypothetical protein
MDTSLNLSPTAGVIVQATPVLERSITTKVQAVEGHEDATTFPAEKPFVAQVVTARLSGAEYPENPAEITPTDRTLRPYDVPMLPYDDEESLPAQVTRIGSDKPG